MYSTLSWLSLYHVSYDTHAPCAVSRETHAPADTMILWALSFIMCTPIADDYSQIC